MPDDATRPGAVPMEMARAVPTEMARAMDTGIHGLLGIDLVEATPERVVVTLPVGPPVHQPYGILHGGVSALLAESAASIGAGVSVAPGELVVGIELNCSHLRSVRTGTITATATPVRKGRRVHVWRVVVADDEGRQTCEARCALSVLPPGSVPGETSTT